MKRFAFTMLELVFIIIVIGILAVLAMPNFNRHPLQEAAEQVASHIRYTQHLAMMDDKFDPNDTQFKANPGYSGTYDHLWFREYWRTRFYTNSSNVYYAVFTDKDREGNIDTTTHTEPAIDPSTGLYFYVGNSSTDPKNNKNMNLTTTYAISSVSSTCDTGNIDIYFDNLGRPYSGSIAGTDPYSALLQNECNVTLIHQTDGNATITIQPETGYVSVSYKLNN
jgi:type II secretory pathway pseudopilin PulG